LFKLFPDSALALSAESFREGVRLWDVATGKPLRTLKKKTASAVQLSPDGKWAVARDDEGTTIYSVTTGEPLLVIGGEDRWKYPLAISHDGQFAVSDHWDSDWREKPTLVLWEITTGKELRAFEKRQRGVNMGREGAAGAAAFTPDGKYILSPDRDSMLRLWNIATGEVVWAVSFDGVYPPFYSANVVAVSPDGAFAFTNTTADGSGGKIWHALPRIWDLLRCLKSPIE
jgi:WD40 repeat protein